MTRILGTPHLHQINLVIIFILYIESTHPLKLLHFDVPQFAPRGAQVSLSCLWQLDAGDELYSVKWYKDGMEFFRYVPGDTDSLKTFPIPGVEVLKFTSTASNITLAAAVQETEGRYRCEVSGERPLFLTVTDYGDLTVFALPSDGPFLSGIGKQYKIGDTINGNCTSGPSRHSIDLAWYINGVPTDGSTVASSLVHRGQGGFVSVLGLKLKLTKQFFGSKYIKIKCLSTIPSVFWKSNETCIVLTSKRIEAQERAIEAKAKSNAFARPNLLNLHLSVLCILVTIYILNYKKT